MKKFIFTIQLTLMSCMALTSCIEKRGEQLTSMLTIESSQDLLDACDIEITYKGKGGIDLTDTITKTKWFKIIVNDSFPTEIGLVNVRYLIKPEYKPIKDSCYLLYCTYELKVKEDMFLAGGKPLYLENVPGNKVVSFLDLINIQVKETENEVLPNFEISGLYTVKKKSPAENDSTSDLYNPATQFFKFIAK